MEAEQRGTKYQRVSNAMWVRNGALHTRYDRNNFAEAARDPKVYSNPFMVRTMFFLATDRSFYFDNRYNIVLALTRLTESDNHIYNGNIQPFFIAK